MAVDSRRGNCLLKTLTLALIGALSLWLAPPAARAQAVVDSGHVQAQLIAQSATAPPGGTVYVALRQKIDRGWHTYWRNSGDAGEPTRIAWTLPAGWRAGDLVWATPQRLPLKTLMDYGYTGEVILPVPITVPASARPGQTVLLKAAVSYLVCEDLCVPEDAVLSLAVKVAAGAPGPDLRWGRAVDRALAQAPKPAGLKAVMARQGSVLRIAITGAALKGADLKGAYFYPYAATVIAHAAPQRIERGPAGLTLTLTPGYDFTRGKPPAAVSGVLALGDRAFEITARPGALPAAARGLGPLAGVGGGGAASDPAGDAAPSLAAALGFAFIGGLILNLMPCVFPVLSMKAAALVRHAHRPRAARAHGLAFLVGVLAAFALLAGALIAAQAAGAAAGWGFQLQSPLVVGALCLVMVLVALNLLGLFEVGGGLQGAGGALASRGGLVGSALTGALAVVVAAPCTAPFMAGALGFALTQPPAVALLVFVALGLGFAAPFTLLAFAPGLLRRLPRPGPWMVVLRRLLAAPMVAAAAWLAWVFHRQAGPQALLLLGAAVLAVAAAAWIVGRGQRRDRTGTLPAMAGAGAVLAAAALLVVAVRSPLPEPPRVAAGSEAFSPQRLEALRAQGRPVLVNFTAAWCVTCQVNERLALSTPPVADALRRTGAAYLKADWTNRDAVIARVLADHGRAGVPLYLLYGRGGGAPVVLPQLLTEGEVVSALEAAAGPQASL